MAFAGPPDKTEEWLRGAAFANTRCLREDGSPVACLVRIPMGQFFGGRSVPVVGIAGVAVGPERRGQGLARRLMRESMRELAAEHVPLAGLYASTQALYRQVGFEQAGHWCGVRIPVHRIDAGAKALGLRPLGDEDTPAVEACYRAFAARFNGPLDRGPYIWRRIRTMRDETFNAFGLDGDDGLDGYLFLAQRRKLDTGRQDIALSDLAYLTPEAGRQLLAFLAGYATMADEVIFSAGPVHPILTLLPLQAYSVQRREYWMLRIVDAKRALESRGYSRGVAAEITLDLTDDLIPANTGLWSLRVEGGRAKAARPKPAERRKAPPAIRCDVRGLAAMYTGFLTPREARLAALADGPDAALDTATAIFSGGTPWMSDMY
jgi:predicted acetyltransferase